MKTLKSELKEMERQRRKLRNNLYRLLDEIEGKPVRRRRTSEFPFNLLEAAIDWLMRQLERSAYRLVTATLYKFDRWRRR